jgi:hypothetical protein
VVRSCLRAALRATLPIFSISGALSGCADPATELRVPTPDAQSFEHTVYPILLRDCGFPGECHGNPQRFFQVFGPGRMRARAETNLVRAPVTGEELTATYRRARSMLAHEEGTSIENCLLLDKPRDGAHEGRDEWGNNVYLSASDPSYQVLLTWARSMLPAPAPDAGRVNPPAAPAIGADAGVR